MTRSLLLALLLWTSATALAQSPSLKELNSPHQEGQLVDRLIGEIQGAPLLRSELIMETRIRLLMEGKVNQSLAGLSPQQLHQGLQALIRSRVLYGEALRLQSTQSSQQAVAEALGTIKERFATDQAFLDVLTRLELTAEELRDFLRRDLVVQKFRERSILLNVNINEKDVETEQELLNVRI